MGGEALATSIRRRQPGDGQGLAQVWLATASYYANLDPERFQAPDAQGLEQWFEERLAQATGDDQFDRVADVDGQVVGLVHAVSMEPLESAPRTYARVASTASGVVARERGAGRRPRWRRSSA